MKYIGTVCPRFDVVYTNNHLVERLFEEAGYEVRRTPLHNREEYRGAERRRRIADGEPWRDLFPTRCVRSWTR